MFCKKNIDDDMELLFLKASMYAGISGDILLFVINRIPIPKKLTQEAIHIFTKRLDEKFKRPVYFN